jgi:hypothetical protein
MSCITTGEMASRQRVFYLRKDKSFCSTPKRLIYLLERKYCAALLFLESGLRN